MEQLKFFDTSLDKNTRKKVEKLLSLYRNLDAIIKSLEEDVPNARMTVNYQANEAQRSNQFNSDVENIVIAKEKVEQKKKIKTKLDHIYNSLRPIQQKIWELRYIDDMYDELVIGELNISRRKYYKEKSAIIHLVAEVFFR